MTRDFYLNKVSLAAYVEKDWFDVIVASGAARPGRFAFAPFDLRELYSPYHERLVELIGGEADRVALAPRSMLDVGSSLGRTFFELCRRFPTVRKATLIEPSENLFRLFHTFFGLAPDAKVAPYVPVLKGHGEVVEVQINTTAMREACAAVDVRPLNVAFQDAPEDLGQFDLVVCSNVIDQCHEPRRLIELLKRSVSPGGMVAISCTYQWQAKYRGLSAEPVRHLDQLFPDDWRPVAEANIPFAVRVNERHWMTFLSHACVFRRPAN